MRRQIGSRTALVAVCVIAAVASGASFAVAGGSSTITACVSKHGGTLYKASTCHHGDKKVTWNKQGPPGIQGPAGTARAWGLISESGGIIRGHDVTSVSNPSAGEYCLQLDSSVPATSTVAVLTPYYSSDSTSANSNTAHIEYDGSCGTNGIYVLTYEVSNTGNPTYNNEGFAIVVP